MPKKKFRFYPGKRQAALLALLAAAIYVLLPQIGAFRSSWKLLGGADPGFTAVAVLFTGATFLAGTGTYCFLAFKRLRYTRTLLVQLAATFVNRLLPAGIGALGANYLYLRHERHTSAQAVSVAAMNNLVGFAGHAVLLAAVLLTYSGHRLAPEGWHGPDPSLLRWIIPAAIITLLLVFVWGRQRLYKTLRGIGGQVASYMRRPQALAFAMVTSLTLSVCNMLSLFFCALALGVHLPFAAVMLVFTLGLGAGSAVPTPGGLGGFEAGLAAGFAGYGIDASTALAAALLYRLTSYWLPMAVGGVTFIASERRGLFDA
jgi:uncharacterized membrane protein YbhN (UPF0104 family)